MSKRKIIAFIITTLTVFSIISISTVIKNYASKPIKMIYYLKDNESCSEVAERFGVKVEDMRVDDRYLSFYVGGK